MTVILDFLSIQDHLWAEHFVVPILLKMVENIDQDNTVLPAILIRLILRSNRTLSLKYLPMNLLNNDIDLFERVRGPDLAILFLYLETRLEMEAEQSK